MRLCHPPALAALALGVIATPLCGGVLDFESLPEPTISQGAGAIFIAPVASHMGFQFHSANFYPPSANSPFANVWGVYMLGPNPSPFVPGYPYGINGERALFTPMYDPGYLCAWTVEREDGGEWLFGGAQFTAVHNGFTGQPFRIVGWRDAVEVYEVTTELLVTAQTFVGAQFGSIAVDKVVITYRGFTAGGIEYSRWFTTDDMHYELVPGPGALSVLAMVGLLRHRRRH